MLIPQIALLVLLTASQAQVDYPWHLAKGFSAERYTVEKVMHTGNSPVVDIEGNGVEEFLAEKAEGFSELVYNQDGTIRAQLNYPTTKPRYFLGACDINRDNRKELFFFYRNKGDTAYLRIWASPDTFKDQMLFPLKCRTGRPEGWDGGTFRAAFLDVNGDGCEDILIPMAAGFDLEPRGIYAYDFHNKKLLWSYPMATVPVKLDLADLKGDGEKEIIVSTGAPGNGAVVNGWPDTRGRLFVLDKHGKLLWSKEMGRTGGGAMAEAADVDLDGKLEVVAYSTGSMTSDTLPGQVFILDGATGEVKHYIEIKAKFQGLKVCDLNRDRKPKILLGGTDGILRILDGTLSEVKEKALTDGILILNDVRDLDGDGTREIMLVTGKGRLLILNERLETVLSENTGEDNYLCPIRNGRSCRLIYTSPQSFTLYDIQKAQILTAKNAYTPFGVISIVLVILLLGSLLAFGLTQAQAESFLAKAPCPALLLDRKGRVKQANPKAKALLGEEALSDFKFPPSKPVSGCVFHPFTVWGKRLLLLEDKSVHENSERAVAWAGMAQKMAHEFKNPLSTLILATQRLQSQMKGREAVRYTETLLEELQRLRQRVDGFMGFLTLKGPELAPTDLYRLLCNLKSKFSQNLPVEVKLEAHFASDLPLIQADPSQLEMALTNLIDNALAAVGPKGRVTLRVTCEEAIRDNSRACEIEIADEGPGIPEEDQKKLFTPYFTTKPSGSGLGLVIAKKVIEDHGGTIKIESKEGIGTRVVVRLPVREKNIAN